MPANRGVLLGAILVVGLLAACGQKVPPPEAPTPQASTPQTESSKLRKPEKPKDPLTVAREEIAGGKAVMVDVRSQPERDDLHLDGSIFLPIGDIREKAGDKDFKEWVAGKLPKDKTLYIH